MISNTLLLPFICFGVYLLLEAADWGLSLAAPYVSRNDEECKAVLGLLKPGWDGNELWLLFGLLSLGACVPALAGSTQGMVLAVLAVLGAVIRLAGCFGKAAFGKKMIARLVSSFSVFALFMMSLTGSSFLQEGESVVSFFGVMFAIWMVLEMFQMGSIYGACKVVNPLGERFRAAFLVSGILSLVLFLISAGMLYVKAEGVYQYNTLTWMGMAGGSVVFFLVAFFSTRMRHVAVGLIASYISCALALLVFLTAGASAMTVRYSMEVTALQQFQNSTVGMGLLGGGVILSLASFAYRLLRKKEEYVWDDHV